MRGIFGFIGILLIAGLALLVGSVAYSWGLAAGTAQVVAPGTVVPVVVPHGLGFGFGFGGFLLFLLVVALLVAAIRARRWSGGPGGWGHGGMRHGPWGPRFDPDDPRVRDWLERDVPPQLQPMLEAWHRRAHGQAAVRGAGDPGSASGGPAAGGADVAGDAASGGTGPTGSR